MRIEVRLTPLDGSEPIVGCVKLNASALHTEIMEEGNKLEEQLLRNRNPVDFSVSRNLLTD